MAQIIIYEADPFSRRRVLHPLLSAGAWATEKRNTHVILGAPHPVLVHEDLTLRLELDELRSIWAEVNTTFANMYDFCTTARG